MFAIYRWILGLLKKEHALFTNYHKSHPHFPLYITLDAVLSFSLVFGAIHLISPHSSAARSLIHVGAEAVPSDELISHLKKENVDAYWFGPLSGYEYTIDHAVYGIANIFYVPGSSLQPNTEIFKYEIKTYKNQGIWDGHTHPLLATANTVTIKINNVLSIKINRASMKGEIATWVGKTEIVGIAYPSRQTLETMITNAKNLRPVQ